MKDITVQRRIEQEQLRQQIALASLEERQALARDLHDAVSQSLFSASVFTELLLQQAETLPPEQIKARLQQLHQLTRSARAEMRTLLLELRPQALQESELDELIDNLALATATRTGAQVQATVDPEVTLPTGEKIAFYRITQEALNNIIKHARATQVHIQLSQVGGAVQLSIEDNGTGFAPDQIPAGRMGLSIMQERAAEINAALHIHSVPGTGTRLTLTWPQPQTRRVTDE